MCNYGIWFVRLKNTFTDRKLSPTQHISIIADLTPYITIKIQHWAAGDLLSYMRVDIIDWEFVYRPISSVWFYKAVWLRDIIQKWKRWASRKRAVRVIRNFYYDYVVPKIYNPHSRGNGYLRLLNSPIING